MYKRIIYPFFERLEPQTSHRFVSRILALANESIGVQKVLRDRFLIADPRLESHAFGLTFANPVGLAAGFDKSARLVGGIYALGFGFTEIGTVTPRPQFKPGRKIFRLQQDQALINSESFSNPGKEVTRRNLRKNKIPGFVTGVNLGPNQESVTSGTAVEDYVIGVVFFANEADYFVINISSPNTFGLRELHDKMLLTEIVQAVIETRNNFAPGKPILVKISPDLKLKQMDNVLEVCLLYGISGLICTNSTERRPPTLISQNRHQSGGLSGRPLAKQSREIVRYCYRHTYNTNFGLILCGGVFPEEAVAGIEAGATLVQGYTPFVYEGPTYPRKVNQTLVAHMEEIGANSIAEIVGTAV